MCNSPLRTRNFSVAIEERGPEESTMTARTTTLRDGRRETDDARISHVGAPSTSYSMPLNDTLESEQSRRRRRQTRKEGEFDSRRKARQPNSRMYMERKQRLLKATKKLIQEWEKRDAQQEKQRDSIILDLPEDIDSLATFLEQHSSIANNDDGDVLSLSTCDSLEYHRKTYTGRTHKRAIDAATN